MNNEPVALTQSDILSILQDANSVSLGQQIWNSTEEYNKLKAIIESAIRYTHPVKEQDEPNWKEMYWHMHELNHKHWSELYALKAHPVKELDEQFKKGFEAGKEEGWKAHKFHHPVKELTDEEIAKVVHELNKKANTPERWVTAMEIGAETIIQLRDELAILRKAQE